jgi:hypothetical protein
MAAKRPDFIAYSVAGTSGQTRWREVGVAFWNRKQSALTVLLDAAPLSGRLVLAAPRNERQAGDEGTAAAPGTKG